jgi:hypothetical protein
VQVVHWFLLLDGQHQSRPGLRFLCFKISGMTRSFAGRLQALPAIAKDIGSHPHDPQRDSGHKDH